MPERERSPCLQMMFTQNFHLPRISVPPGELLAEVAGLAHTAKTTRLHGLEADDKSLAAAGLDELHQFRILGHVDGTLRNPTDLQWDQGAKQLFRRLVIRHEVVIHKEDELSVLVLDLRDNVLNRPHTLFAIKIRRDGAEVAGKPATAPVLDETDRQVSLALEQVPPRQKSARLRIVS